MLNVCYLQELNFSRCSRGGLTGDSILLHASARCRNLTHVDASWCNVTDNGIAALSECAHRYVVGIFSTVSKLPIPLTKIEYMPKNVGYFDIFLRKILLHISRVKQTEGVWYKLEMCTSSQIFWLAAPLVSQPKFLIPIPTHTYEHTYTSLLMLGLLQI